MKKLPILLLAFVWGCSPSEPPAEPESAPETPPTAEQSQTPEPGSAEKLAAILDAQPDEVKARYQYRHPKETLEFFGVEPGMTVVEALPGGGWYTKILLPYVGSEGRIIGADYAMDMWAKFPFYSDELGERKKIWVETWTEQARGWGGDDGPDVQAFTLGSLPEEHAGTADVVLFVRAMHNLARFEGDGGYLSAAINDAYKALKPGGILGVVQHHGRDELPDDWTKGDRGYLKKGFLVDAVTKAGFELVDESDVNANPNDQPGEGDIVWRLAPGFNTTEDGSAEREELAKIGESNRMTLKFQKPI